MEHLKFAAILGAGAAIAAYHKPPLQGACYPNPVTLIVPWAPGGAIDVSAALAPAGGASLHPSYSSTGPCRAPIAPPLSKAHSPDAMTLLWRYRSLLSPDDLKKLPDPPKTSPGATPFELPLRSCASRPLPSFADLVQLAKGNPTIALWVSVAGFAAPPPLIPSC